MMQREKMWVRWSARKRCGVWWLSAGLVWLDLWTKAIVHQHGVGTDHALISIVKNEWSLWWLQIPIWLLIGMGVVMIGVLCVYAIRRASWYQRCAIALIIAGIIGNTRDRAMLGYVRDMIDLWWRPVFNIADICLVWGLIVFVFLPQPLLQPSQKKNDQADT